jgi:hypothetical protein
LFDGPVELSDATRSEFPAPELGDAVFATPEGTVPPPVHSALGWHVLKVTKVTPGQSETFEQARDALRARVAAAKAIETTAGPPAPVPTSAELRSWARSHGFATAERGRISAEIRAAWERAQTSDSAA